MTKKRRAPLRLAPADTEEADVDDEEAGPRPAPNTNFLGRLVRGVATGNQRQIDATTSGAANLSIGATGAASLRLQLQRARSARFQTLRRVVLSSAEKQRLTLCTALLAEVAQGFGFRLTVRQPDGQEVGARQAVEAVARMHSQMLDEQHDTQAAASIGAGADGDADVVAEGSPDDGAALVQAGGGGNGGIPPDPINTLMPLEVELGMGLESLRGESIPRPAGEALKSLVGGGLATRLAKSPSGMRPARPGGSLTALLSGRLMSATLGSMGLVDSRKSAAAQAVQAARRRVLMRAASNSVSDAAVAAAADAGAAPPRSGSGVDQTGDAEVPRESSAPCGDAGANAPAAPGAATIAAASTSSNRRIVWNPDNLPKMGAVGPVQQVGGGAGSGRQEGTAFLLPPAKRARTVAAAIVAPAPAGPTCVEAVGGSGDDKSASAALNGTPGAPVAAVAEAEAEAKAATTPPKSSAEDGGGERDGRKQVTTRRVAGGSEASGDGVSSGDGGGTGKGEGKDDEGQGKQLDRGSRDAGRASSVGGTPGGPPPAEPVTTSGSDRKVTDESEIRGNKPGSRCGSAEAPHAPGSLEAKLKRTEGPGSAAASPKEGKDVGPVRSVRLLEAALARSAAPSGPTRLRAPIHTGSAAGISAVTATKAVVSDDVEIEPEAEPSNKGRTEDSLDAGAGLGPGPSTASAGAPRVGAANSRGTSTCTGAGKPAGFGALGTPAGKLFGAAMRQLQRRSQG